MSLPSHRYFSEALILAGPLLALACGGSQQSADGDTSRLGSPQWTSATGAATEPAVVEEAPRAPQCSGGELNATRLARSGACDIEGHSEPLPASVVATIASDRHTVVSGQDVDVVVILRNTGDATAELLLDHSCGFENLTTKVLRDSHNNRLDRVGRGDCPLDAACVGQVAHLSLDPGGQATITLPLRAAVSVIGEACEELPGRALSPGAYTVEWKTPYAQQPFTTKLNVEKLQRLPEAQCKTYARIVAQKAEPDIKLRRAVEKDLLASCLQEQPSQAFADCRMNATTELSLAECQEVMLPR